MENFHHILKHAFSTWEKETHFKFQESGDGAKFEYASLAWPLSDGQLQLIQRAGLLPLLKWHSFSLDAPLLTAIVERWQSETNTFHFPCGEMTITLQDVAHILGLRVIGEVVSGCSISKDDARELCNRLLGKVHWEPYKNAMLDDVPDELQQILLDSETAQGKWTETGDRDRKLQYFQSVIKRVIGVLRPILCRSDDVGIEEALGDLQNLANMDIDALDVDNEENREHVRSESTPTIQHVYVSKTRAGGRGAGKGDEGTSKGHGGRGAGEGAPGKERKKLLEGAGEGEEKTNRECRGRRRSKDRNFVFVM
ncbi:hypothetical protein HHK36_028499 [Tetracentron sinense]|uniref:Aminotransferase-like plant mobile domain-containing protein n=1 Tax=Tetracentron sinense TaxID=13715 RepID=A0A835D0A5_TETSI|nr:hypothetical protein HHK36_028499 [Tetracentron sinense]